MNKLLTVLLFSLVSVSAFAGGVPPPPVSVPEPSVLALLGIGIAGMLLAKRNKK